MKITKKRKLYFLRSSLRKINMVIILLLLKISLKCENWYSEFTGHKRDSNAGGFDGSSTNKFRDFYLFSKKKYKAHYYDDYKNTQKEK